MNNEIFCAVKNARLVYPTVACLCGAAMSFSWHVSKLKEYYDANAIHFDLGYIRVFTSHFEKIKYYNYMRHGDLGLWELLIPNPIAEFIVLGDITCCSMPVCLDKLCSILTEALGERVFWDNDKIYNCNGSFVAELPRLRYRKFDV